MSLADCRLKHLEMVQGPSLISARGRPTLPSQHEHVSGFRVPSATSNHHPARSEKAMQGEMHT